MNVPLRNLKIYKITQADPSTSLMLPISELPVSSARFWDY
jgi:hypothetical protein